MKAVASGVNKTGISRHDTSHVDCYGAKTRNNTINALTELLQIIKSQHKMLNLVPSRARQCPKRPLLVQFLPTSIHHFAE